MSELTNHGDALNYLQNLVNDNKLTVDEYKTILYKYKVRGVAALQIGQLGSFIKEIKIFIKNKNK